MGITKILKHKIAKQLHIETKTDALIIGFVAGVIFGACVMILL